MTSPKRNGDAKLIKRWRKGGSAILRLPDLQSKPGENDGSQGTDLSINPSLYRMTHEPPVSDFVKEIPRAT